MLKVLSTKLLGENLVDSASQLDIALTCLDFIEVRDLDFDIAIVNSLIFDAVVFTSSNAVTSFLKKAANALAPSPLERAGGEVIYSLSGKTKDELLKQGISTVAVADNAEQLADLIIANNKIRSVLHICGNLTLDTLQNRLMTAGLSYVQFQVYETVLNSIELNEDFDAIMFYSPSGVESFAMKNEINIDTLYCCIGLTTAEKLKSVNDKIDIILPKQPTPEAMLRAIKDFKK
jgi:uroporphyrinogen-III synthase